MIYDDDIITMIHKKLVWISYWKKKPTTGNESLTGLAVEAAQKALQMAEVEPDDVDLILLCTSTAEDLFGGAPQVEPADMD